jgi:DNA ligase-1
MNICTRDVLVMEFPVLYSKSKTGKTRIWKIRVESFEDYSMILTCFGEVAGKQLTSKSRIDSGKNIGKANETTHYTQALSEAKSKWENKCKTGFTETENVQNVHNTYGTSVSPMLANVYQKHKAKVVFPCYAQPKLDGYRVIYNPITDKFTSRTGKEYTVLNNSKIHNEVKKLNTKHILDGELYKHGMIFEKYGILRKKSIDKEDTILLDTMEYHVYDIIDQTLSFSRRCSILDGVKGGESVIIVKTSIVLNEKELDTVHTTNVYQGYEGTMIRNGGGRYTCGYRSYDLLKYKNFQDAEFEIVGRSSEMDQSGNNEPLVVWVCKCPDSSETFEVQPKDSIVDRKKMYVNYKQYVNKMITVQFFGYTNLGIPRFPKTLRSTNESIRL